MGSGRITGERKSRYVYIRYGRGMFRGPHGGTKWIRVGSATWPQNLLTGSLSKVVALCALQSRCNRHSRSARFSHRNMFPNRTPADNTIREFLHTYTTWMQYSAAFFSRDTIYFNENWRESRWRKCRPMSLAIISRRFFDNAISPRIDKRRIRRDASGCSRCVVSRPGKIAVLYARWPRLYTARQGWGW